LKDYEIVADDADFFHHEYENDPKMFEEYDVENKESEKSINYDLFSYDASCICSLL
jgi:hypothetical protein